MALIKCTECGQEVSTEARVCPHCGNPNMPIAIKQAQSKKYNWTTITWILLVVLMFVGLSFLAQWVVSSMFGLNAVTPYSPQQQTPSGQAIPLQEVKNLGYDFYVGQIDNADANNLTDDLKNQITKIVYDAHFPEKMLQNMPIIILNSLYVTGDQYIPIAGKNLEVGNLDPTFLSEGGFYATYNGSSTVIFINKSTTAQGQLTDILTHELGHAVGSTLTAQDWKEFYQLRNISSSTPRHGTNWNLSPEEDFAEVYMNTFTGIAIKTQYGSSISPLESGGVVTEDIHTYIQLVAQKAAQAAKIRGVYTVNQATKDFIVSIVNRLNQ